MGYYVGGAQKYFPTRVERSKNWDASWTVGQSLSLPARNELSELSELSSGAEYFTGAI